MLVLISRLFYFLSSLRRGDQSTFVLEAPLCNSRPGMCDFVPSDQIVQSAYLTICIDFTDFICKIAESRYCLD